MSAKKKAVRPEPVEGSQERTAMLGVREGPITPYLTRPQQLRHSREGGNPVREPWPLPPKWRWAQMGDVAEVIGGGTPKTDREDYFGGDIPWITPADLSGYKEKTISRGKRNITQLGLENSGTRLMPAGSVLFSSRAPIGYVAIATNPVCTNQGFKSIVLSDKLLPDYVYYWLHVAKKIAVEMASGTTFLEISGKKVAQIPIPIAPLDEQRRIVAELETQLTRLDASVTALKRAQANLKRYRASVLKAACEGRLVPTEAELARSEGRCYEPGVELLARILKERRAAWKGRGEFKEPTPVAVRSQSALPTGWCLASVEQLGDVGTGATPKRGKAAYYEGGAIPWVTSGVVGKSFVRGASEFVTEKAVAETNLTIYPAGTLLVAMYGEGKTRGKCSELLIAATTNQALAAIEAYSSIKAYLKVFLLMNYEETRKAASGGVQPNLNLSLIRSICIPLPPLEEQHRIVAEVERCLSVIEELEAAVAANVKRAERLRRAILARAFATQ